ncbi:MAG: hypothetical protein RR328_07325, partial [Bacteroidales bacterium]
MKVKCYLRWWILLCNAFILLSTVSANPLGMEAKPIKDSSQNRAISKAKDTTKYAIFKKLNTGSTYFFYDQTLQTSVPYFTPIDTGLWMVQRFNPVYNGPDFRA